MDNQHYLPKKESEEDHDSSLPAESNSISSHEIQPSSPTLSRRCRQTSHTSVNISDDISATSSVSSQNKMCSCYESLYKVVLYILLIPFFCAFYLCLAVVILALIFSLTIICSLIIATAALPLLLLSIIITRLLQFFSHGEAYDKAIQLKLFIRTWILLDMVVFLIILWIFFSFFEYVTGLNHVILLGLTLVNWVRLYNVIFGIYILSCAVSVVTNNLLPLVPLDHSESGLNVPETILEIIDCLTFWLAESVVMKRVSVFKQHKILGMYTQKWIEVTIFTLIAYNVITLSTHMIVWLLRNLVCQKFVNPGTNTKSRRYLLIEKFLRRRYLVYWANGLKRSINFILSSLLLLLIWVCYFGSHLDKTPQTKNILKFGLWTFLSLLMSSILWLIKSCVLLSWEACSVYDRLHSKILESGKQLYFLGIIGRHNYDILNLLYECKEDKTLLEYDTDERRLRKLISKLCNTLFPTRVMNLHARYLSKFDDVDEWGGDGEVNVKKLLRKKKKRVKHELLMKEGQTPTLYCIQQASGYFLTAKKTLLKEKYTCDILKNLESHIQVDGNGGINEILKRLIQIGNNTNDATQNSSEDPPTEKDDWDYFEDQMQEYVGSSQEISLQIIRTWMERARNNGLFLANTLSSAKEVVECLNKIISWLLIVATFIMWLLLTGLATTKVLVLIASPLLAATFVFGDACKTLFQGIMFAYVVHPFDVGDLCIIDGNMMEVKTVGVWKTTFSKVDMQEEVIYPNSELSNKNIINYKTDFNWNDYVELDIASLDEEKIKILKQEIEEHLDDEKYRFTSGYTCVEVLTIGDNIKIAVNFRHEVNLKNSTYFECLKEKRKRRSELILHAQSLLNHMKNGRSKTSVILDDLPSDHLTFAAEKYEDMIETRNGSLMHLPESGDDDTFIAGKIEGIYGG